MAVRNRWNALLFVLLLAGCSAPAAKTAAWDTAALERRLPQAGLVEQMGDERVVQPGTEWLAGLPTGRDLTFLGIQDRITSYNVCYTKLLRFANSAR